MYVAASEILMLKLKWYLWKMKMAFRPGSVVFMTLLIAMSMRSIGKPLRPGSRILLSL